MWTESAARDGIEKKKVSGEETNIIPPSCRNQPGVMMMSMYAQQLLECTRLIHEQNLPTVSDI